MGEPKPLLRIRSPEVVNRLGLADAAHLREMIAGVVEEGLLHFDGEPYLGRSESVLVPRLGIATIVRSTYKQDVELAVELYDAVMIQVGLAGGYWIGDSSGADASWIQGRELRVDLLPGASELRMGLPRHQYLNCIFIHCPR